MLWGHSQENNLTVEAAPYGCEDLQRIQFFGGEGRGGASITEKPRHA